MRGRPGARSDDLPPGVPPSGKGQQVLCLENINGDGAARSKATVNANERQTVRKSASDGSRCGVRHAGGRRHASKAEVTCCDAKRREVTQRTVTSCSAASCYVMQCHVIQCSTTRRKGPLLACGGCCRVAFPYVFFLLVCQPAQSHSDGRGQGSQQRKRGKVQTQMPRVGAYPSKNCHGRSPLTVLPPMVLSRCRARVQSRKRLQSGQAAKRSEAPRLLRTCRRILHAVTRVLWYTCRDTRAVACVLR